MRTLRTELRYLLRWLGAALTVLSLLLCVAAAALWARGHWVADTLLFDGAHTDGHSTAAWSCAVGFSRAGIAFRGDRGSYTSVAPVPPQRYSASVEPVRWVRTRPSGAALDGGIPATAPRVGGFALYYSGNRAGTSATFTSSYLGQWYVQCPYWALFAVPACVPVVRGWRWYRWRRPPGTCPGCGYDLRASPDRCPECGRVRTS